MGEIFYGGNAAQKIENRSLQTTDIPGASAKRSQLTDLGYIAGKQTGSPKRKNESSVFSHLNDGYDWESLKRKELAQISKPQYVANNLSNSATKFAAV